MYSYLTFLYIAILAYNFMNLLRAYIFTFYILDMYITSFKQFYYFSAQHNILDI